MFKNFLNLIEAYLLTLYVVDAVRSSRILIGKQKLGVTFNSDKLGGAMALPVMEFQDQGYKIRKIFA